MTVGRGVSRRMKAAPVNCLAVRLASDLSSPRFGHSIPYTPADHSAYLCCSHASSRLAPPPSPSRHPAAGPERKTLRHTPNGSVLVRIRQCCYTINYIWCTDICRVACLVVQEECSHSLAISQARYLKFGVRGRTCNGRFIATGTIRRFPSVTRDRDWFDTRIVTLLWMERRMEQQTAGPSGTT